MNPLKHFIKRDISKDRSIDDNHKEIEGNNTKNLYPRSPYAGKLLDPLKDSKENLKAGACPTCHKAHYNNPKLVRGEPIICKHCGTFIEHQR